MGIRRHRFTPMGRPLRGDRINFLIAAIRKNLSPDLLHEDDRYHDGSGVGTAGHCYVASEVLYHMLGGKKSGLKPCNGRLWDMQEADDLVACATSGIQHWWLEDEDGNVIDPTADQFPDGFPYEVGRGRGFLTAKPSKRAKILMQRVREWIASKP